MIIGYTSVSRLINTEPSELLRLRLSEPIASESVMTYLLSYGNPPKSASFEHLSFPCI